MGPQLVTSTSQHSYQLQKSQAIKSVPRFWQGVELSRETFCKSKPGDAVRGYRRDDFKAELETSGQFFFLVNLVDVRSPCFVTVLVEFFKKVRPDVPCIFGFYLQHNSQRLSSDHITPFLLQHKMVVRVHPPFPFSLHTAFTVIQRPFPTYSFPLQHITAIVPYKHQTSQFTNSSFHIGGKLL